MGTHPIFESDFDCLTARGGHKSPGWLTLQLTRSVRSWTRRRISVICPSLLTSITANPPSLTHLSVKPVLLLVPKLVKPVSPTLERTNKNVVLLSSLQLFPFTMNLLKKITPVSQSSNPTQSSHTEKPSLMNHQS